MFLIRMSMPLNYSLFFVPSLTTAIYHEENQGFRSGSLGNGRPPFGHEVTRVS
jgi:hypothetical protein